MEDGTPAVAQKRNNEGNGAIHTHSTDARKRNIVPLGMRMNSTHSRRHGEQPFRVFVFFDPTIEPVSCASPQLLR